MSGEHKQETEIKQLLQTIDDNPDMLHGDFTPSVFGLITQGLRGARAALDLLGAEKPLTRLHAQRVIEGVVMHRHGWRAGQGYPDPSGQEKTQALLATNGNYQASASPEERMQAIEKWRRWLEAQED